MAATTKKSAGKAKKSATAKRPAKAKKAKPTKKRGTLRAPKQRSGGDGVTLNGIIFTDSSTPPLPAGTKTNIQCFGFNVAPPMPGDAQSTGLGGAYCEPGYSDLTPTVNPVLTAIVIATAIAPGVPGKSPPMARSASATSPGYVGDKTPARLLITLSGSAAPYSLDVKWDYS